MNPVLQQALERLAEARAEAGGPPSFALWELRATLRGRTDGGVTSVAADGGWRLEWGREGARGSRFAVGAGPGARLLAGQRTPGRLALDPRGWEAALSAIDDALRRELPPLIAAAAGLGARLAAGAGPPAAVALEIHLRWRAWRRGAAVPRYAEERGFRALAGAPEVETPGSGVAPKPIARTGPLVLLAPAAGWWVHEMGHAALESASRIGPVPAGHGLSILDDPAAGSWPAGFAVDDAGDRAAAATLWDAAGPHPAPRRGRRRRPSVRDAAEGALSVTRLVGEAPAGVQWADLPEGTPVAGGVRAGRFDPPTGVIALELEGVGSVRGGIPVPGTGRAVALVEAAVGWRGLRRLAPGPVEDGAFASCSRLGATVPVMVGAPTIVLDPVQVIP